MGEAVSIYFGDEVFRTLILQTARMLITAYCLTGHTATGTIVHRGSIAVDPTVIPLGDRVCVPTYGCGRAEDTGSAIKGNHVDIWLSSCADADHVYRYERVWWK